MWGTARSSNRSALLGEGGKGEEEGARQNDVTGLENDESACLRRAVASKKILPFFMHASH